ncbi:MAG: VCBS repeat-containing protein, partial [Myxococcota bacterium]|nr:VCBS repeat-containing protein [Myxococcota bacterium]
DGQPDLVVSTHYAGAYTADSFVYYADGGYLDADRAALPSSGAYEAAAADLDGDGYQDIVIANYFDGATRNVDSTVYWGSATGHSSADRTQLPTVGAVDLLVEDLDGDGYPELVFTGYYNDSSFDFDSYVYWGSAAGYSAADRTDLPTTGGWKSVSADFDGDGHRDLAFCSYYSGGYATDSHVYWGSASGFSRTDRTALPTLGCRDVVADDINGDGYTDLLFASYYSGSSHLTDSRVYYASPAGFSTTSYTDLATDGALSAATGDFNGDGFTDVALGGYYTGSWTYAAFTRVYWNSATGLSSASYSDLGTSGVRFIESADLDNDGHDDLVGPRYYSGTSYDADSHVWWGSAAGLSDIDRTDLPTTGTAHATVGDLNGDGAPEIAFTGYFGGSWGSFVDDVIYWGDASDPDVYSPADATDLDTAGTWGRIVFAGDTAW